MKGEVMKFEYHPLSNIFPLMEGAPFDELVDDIKANGLREPITLLDGLILDGRNRYRACKKLNIEPAAIQFKSADPLAFVISLNLRRRHLKESQRATIAAKLSTARQGRRTDLGKGLHEITVSQAAQMLNISERSVALAKVVQNNATAKIKECVESGAISISAAASIAHLSTEKQNALAEKGSSAIVAEARRITRRPLKQGRSEFAAIWAHVDEIIDGLENRRLDKADMAAMALRREIAKVAAARK